MVRLYHGTDRASRVAIEEVGLLPGQFTKGTIQPFVYMSKSKRFATTFGGDVVEIHVPKALVYEGSTQGGWIASGKPIWLKTYKPEAIAKGLPRKYIRAVIVNGKRVKLDPDAALARSRISE